MPDYRTLYSDFVALAEMARAQPEYQHLPTFILAHSLGTLITSLSINHIPNITAVVFSGMAIYPGFASASPFGVKALYPLSKTSAAMTISRMMASIDPKGDAGPIIDAEITSSVEELDLHFSDARTYFGQIRNKTAFESLKMMKEVLLEIPKITVPFKAIHGVDDQICLLRGR